MLVLSSIGWWKVWQQLIKKGTADLRIWSAVLMAKYGGSAFGAETPQDMERYIELHLRVSRH